jgi:hypothetical protein
MLGPCHRVGTLHGGEPRLCPVVPGCGHRGKRTRARRVVAPAEAEAVAETAARIRRLDANRYVPLPRADADRHRSRPAALLHILTSAEADAEHRHRDRRTVLDEDEMHRRIALTLFGRGNDGLIRRRDIGALRGRGAPGEKHDRRGEDAVGNDKD